MTAGVRTHFTGRDIRPLTGFILRSIKAQANGDNPVYVGRPAGQLWERLAEQSETYPFAVSLRFRTRRLLRELAILNGEDR